MTDEQWLRRESAALLALLDTCEKPDTWTSIANDCVLEGSAERIYHHHLDPSAHSLEREENDAYAIQGTLLDDPPSPTLVTRLENAYKIADNDSMNGNATDTTSCPYSTRDSPDNSA